MLWKRVLTIAVSSSMAFTAVPTIAAADDTLPEPIFSINFDNGDMTADTGKATETGSGNFVTGVNGTTAYGFNASCIAATNDDGTSLLTGLDEFTVTYWANTGTTTGWTFYAAPTDATQTYKQEQYVGILDNNTAVTSERYSNSGSRSESAKADGLESGWKMVTVAETADQIKLYINGEQKAAVDSSVDISDLLGESSIAWIGKAPWGTGEYASGTIDDYAVYDTVLTDTQIAELYSETRAAIPMSGKIKLHAGDIAVKADFTTEYNDDSETVYGYIAAYDENGELAAVEKTEGFTENSELSLDITDDMKEVKAYMWDSENVPICNAVSKDMTEEDSGKFADTADVTLEDGSIFAESEETGLEYVKSIDVDRLLAPSYEVHGLTAPNDAERYGGWEREGANNWTSSGGAKTYTLAGHSLGHWMSAAAVFYRDTGDTEILEKLNYAVDKLDELQTTTGSAYIGGCYEDTFTKCFAGNTNWVSGYWVPWYGIHKIYQGLVDAYRYTENETAFTVLEKFADWAVDGTSNLTDSQMQTVLDTEYGGMNEIFAMMYGYTGDEKYLTAARRFTHDTILNPLISGTDSLSGLHANTQIPKIVGAAEIYDQDPDDYADYRTACENFWNFVVNNRSYAIGGNSIAEHFEGLGEESLGVKTCESCNTYNMMRLTEHLFSWEHDTAYMDWYEDALYNHILGQQEPETGAKMYFVSLLQGHHRVYEVKDESWWCCTGTGMENPGRYTRCVYFEDGDDLYVNLYMPNDYTWESKGLEFKTETNYPYSDTVNMTVTSGSAAAAISFRVPSWVAGEATAVVNGETFSAKSGWLTINRTWSEGDTITLTLPMAVRTYYSREDNQIAYKYGPLTLAAPLGDVDGVSGVSEYISNETKIDTVTASVPYIITNDEDPESFVTLKDADTLTFVIPAENISTGEEIELVPFYGVHHEFYTVYWNVNTEADAFEKALNDVTTDKVEPDGQQDEIGHAMETNTSGSVHQGSFTGTDSKTHMYRDAWGTVDSGSEDLPYFSYSLDVADGQNYLYAAYWGSDVPFTQSGVTYTRDFNIYVDGTLIGEQTINNNNPNSVYNVFYEIPEELTADKETVTVKFEAKTTTSCAGMLELRTTTAVVDDE